MNGPPPCLALRFRICRGMGGVRSGSILGPESSYAAPLDGWRVEAVRVAMHVHVRPSLYEMENDNVLFIPEVTSNMEVAQRRKTSRKLSADLHRKLSAISTCSDVSNISVKLGLDPGDFKSTLKNILGESGMPKLKLEVESGSHTTFCSNI